MEKFPHAVRATIAIVLLFGISAVNCLRCYQCSTLTDQRCGVTWGYQGTEADQYRVDCPTNGTVEATACWKYIRMDTPDDIPIVYRSCWYPHWNESIEIQPWFPHWNATVTTGSFTPNGCNKVRGWTHAKSCYCTDNTHPCNSVSAVTASYWSAFLSLLLGGLILIKIR